MFPSNWVLKAVAEIPATSNTLAGIAERHGASDGMAVVKGLVAEGRLVMIGARKAARYCLPGMKKKGGRK